MNKTKTKRETIGKFNRETISKLRKYQTAIERLENKCRPVLMDGPRPSEPIQERVQTDLIDWSFLERVRDLRNTIVDDSHIFSMLKRDIKEILFYHDVIKRWSLTRIAPRVGSPRRRRKPPL